MHECNTALVQDSRNDGGLREANRRERLRAIHIAARELVETLDLSAVTIDAIAERAGVSRRTFFNYFATKEDAVLGLLPVYVPEGALEDFARSGEDDLTRAAHLLMAIVMTGRINAETSESRRELIRRVPELAARQRRQSHDAQELVLSALAEHAASAGDADPGEIDRRRILVLISGIALRFAVDRDPRVLDGLLPSDIDDAAVRIRTILKEL